MYKFEPLLLLKIRTFLTEMDLKFKGQIMQK